MVPGMRSPERCDLMVSAKYFSLPTPCASCPFLIEPRFYLDPQRVDEIAESIRDGASFSCHKTVDYDDDSTGRGNRERQCAGVLITLEKEDAPNQMMRIAERVGMYDRAKLNMDANVYDSLDDWQENMKD
jgi:hypothetical protein